MRSFGCDCSPYAICLNLHCMSRARQTVLVTTALLTAAVALPARQEPPPAAQNPPASQDQDAAAKAAARKKRFEETKRQLENQSAELPAQSKAGQTASAAAPKLAQTKPANVVSSMPVTMMIGEVQRFFLYDNDSTPPDVTTRAQWTVVDEGSVAELSVIDGVPNVAGKKKGSISLYGTWRDRGAEVQLTIVTPEEIGNAVRWRQTPPTDKESLHIVPAIPSHVLHH
jgi:hypothetical protein